MEDPKHTTPSSRAIRFETFENGEVRQAQGALAAEVAMELSVNGRAHSLFLRTPGAERELIAGYLFTEGLIESFDDIVRLEFDKGAGVPGGESLKAFAEIKPSLSEDRLPERPSLSLSSCGYCGKGALSELNPDISRVRSRQRYSWETLQSLLSDLRPHQPLYALTRGVHAAAMYRADGTFIDVFEDVGRHNALDKLIGRGLMLGGHFDDKLAILSGRASLEMVLKTARAGLPLLLCFSAPTALAFEAAKILNLTLVGRLKNSDLAGYTHTRRLISQPGAASGFSI